MSAIRFYKTAGTYGCFSNFSRHAILIDGKVWLTSEHYFQAKKFAGTEHESTVRLASNAWMAAKEGRRRDKPMRKDWELVKEDVMYIALQAKFTQHEGLKATLLSTEDAELIEDSPIDWYWGCGANGKGKNRLGVLLMRLREELREKDDRKIS